MCNQSTQEITSIAINSAIGGNEDLYHRALKNLQTKPRAELLQGIFSIIIHLKEKGINGSFMGSAEQIFNGLQQQGGGK